MRLPERLNVALELVDSHIRLGRGNKAAILCGEQTVSYANLHDSVNRVGNALIDMGVRREERVAILLPDRPEWAFAFFGAIKIGAVAVPLNTMLAPEDCQYVINDSGARVLVVDRAQLDRIAKIRASLSHVKNVIVIDDDVDGCASMEEIQRTCSPSLHAADTSQSDMAFWLYSSGTTAVPKGVIHRHRDMIVAADQYAKQTIGLRETDVSFSVAKLFFAYGLGNGLYFPLRCGGTTVLLPDAALPETVFDIFDRHQPTVFYSVPTSYAGLLHTAEKTGRTSLGRVRMCVSAGETLPKIIYEKWHERFGVEIFDGIGSTEMLHIYISNRPGQVKAGSTGTLVPGYEAKILDEDGHEVPTGVVGRLLVKGESAAAGYWNRDDDTRETFRGGWLDSRDSFKVDEDGFYWYAGRSDDMIKVAGQAVWPARVESILQRHPAVVECAVAGAPGPDGLIKPRAAVVLNQGYKASPELVRQLQHFVRKNASPHECPHQVTFVEKLPKTATGKIQRFKLRKSASGSDQPTPPPQAQADGLRSRQETSDVFERISHAPPARRMELLASHLQRELERILYLPEPPALDAGFSELGMDSLRAVEFRDLLQSQFGHQLTLSSTLAFDYPSVNQLARHLVDQLWPLSNNAAKQSHRRFDPSEPLAVIGLACRFP
ncbi:MAG: benzoate-CoA ligase family protein, partial [Candidatus Binatia bacterium]